ncbi:DUF1320 family protein [Vibrio parahaemolyticus]|nr:DUF1320 family protein [Vibrio parahaemolyticus]
MYYFNIDDFIAAFGTDDLPLNESDAVETNKVESAIERAEREAHSYLRSAGITVPLVNTDAIQDIKGAVLDIARVYVNDDHVTEQMTERHKFAVEYFQSVASGKTVLIATESSTPASGFFNVHTII